MSSLDNVKTLLELEGATQDAILNVYLNRAENFVRSYCNIPDEEVFLPATLDDLIEDIAILKYRLKGVEGIKSEGKGSLSESYIEGLPQDMINQLNKYRRVSFL